jgi:hypothetical protein
VTSSTFFLLHPGRVARKLALFVCAVVWTNYPLRGGVTADGMATSDEKSTTAATAEEQPEEYKNWIELGIGGVIVDGDRAQFEQEHRRPGDEVFGGIQDLHYEQTIGKDVQLLLDGHAIFDTNDYGLRLELSKPKLGYIRFGYDEFRTWYDGNGGFFPPNGQFFSPRFPEMHIDRGDAWVELGLRVPDWPEITLRYSHQFRDGQKDSTIWGDTNQTGPTGVTRKIAPAFRNIDETRDILALDVSKTIGNTDVLLGMRYEHNENDYSLNMERGAGQLPPVVSPPGAQRFVTQHQKDDVDLFSGHAITETRFTDSLWFTTGYSYTTFANDLSGSRLFGTDFDAAFGEPVPTLGRNDHSFINLAGTAEVKEHVINANLFWMPAKDLALLTAFRYTHEERDSAASFLAVEPEANTEPFTSTNPEGGFHLGTPTPASGARSADYDRFAQRLELRYTGIADWSFYAQAEWEEEFGHVDEFHTDEEVPLDKDTDFLGQKYTVGVNWYPLMRLNVSGQYYHKIAAYGDDIISASFPRLIDQDWNTDDLNVRITFRPKIPISCGTLSLVSRYDFVRTTIDGRWEIFSDGELLDEQQTGVITKHVISESITWSPLARLYFQTDFSYVLDQTDTPASSINLISNTSPTVRDFRNDYWTVTAATGYIINDKTDLHAEYTFYRANDYFNNSDVAVPYGMGATEHTASATLTRQLTKQVRLLLKYTYFSYTDQTSGGHNNYEAHSIFSSLQFRF